MISTELVEDPVTAGIKQVMRTVHRRVTSTNAILIGHRTDRTN